MRVNLTSVVVWNNKTWSVDFHLDVYEQISIRPGMMMDTIRLSSWFGDGFRNIDEYQCEWS